MNREDHDHTVEMIELGIHRYFDHYLTDVFPGQMERLFESHNKDVDAHPVQFTQLTRTKRRVDKAAWMIAGVVALVSVLTALGALWGHLFPR
jgi:hypothetical protein